MTEIRIDVGYHFFRFLILIFIFSLMVISNVMIEEWIEWQKDLPK